MTALNRTLVTNCRDCGGRVLAGYDNDGASKRYNLDDDAYRAYQRDGAVPPLVSHSCNPERQVGGREVQTK